MATDSGSITASSMNAVELATELTVAWLGNQNNRVSADDVPAFLRKMHQTVLTLHAASGTEADAPAEQSFEPAVTPRKSLASPDHIISMIDGKPYRTLRRHLATNGLTPEQYRERYSLKADYPMVAPTYSEARRAMAKKTGLGRKAKPAGEGATSAAMAPTAAAAPRGRRIAKVDV